MGAKDVWADLHSGAYKEKLKPEIKELWDMSYRANVNPFLEKIPLLNIDLEAEKLKSIDIYAYTNRYMWVTGKYYTEDGRMGIALFSKDGILLSIYCNDLFKEWLNDRGIKPLTDWTIESIGANAVAGALIHKKPIEIIGEWNYCNILGDVAMFVSPIMPASVPSDDSGQGPLGAIAVVTDADSYCPYSLGISYSFAYDIQYSLFNFTLLNGIYAREEKGFISVDKSAKTGVYSMLYNNLTACEIMGIPGQNMGYKPLSYIVDSLPDNKEFWDMLESEHDYDDVPVYVSVRGKKKHLIMSFENYRHNALRARGCMLTFSAPEHVAAQVSKRIGNNARFTFYDIVGNSPRMEQVKETARQYAASDSNVLIIGESGTGKDILAQAIHNASIRRNRPFISINCAALPRELIASELFGYDSGAFTGAKKSGNIGKFELANNGTIFLDEIGDMPLDIQATLLHVLESRSFTRLGGNQQVDINVKIIAATNADLLKLVDQKRFRLDLFYRLSVLTVRIPPLRVREDDIVDLADHFLRTLSSRVPGIPEIVLSEAAGEYLKQLPWNGNVRELQNTIEGIAQTQQVTVIKPEHIQKYREISGLFSDDNPVVSSPAADSGPIVVKKYSRDEAISKDDLIKALSLNKYNKEATAKSLGISRKTLYRWMKSKNL